MGKKELPPQADDAQKNEKGADEKEKQSFMEKLQNTVRQRKKNKAASTQRYIPIAEIRNDTVVLKNGGLRAVLNVEPINFNLKSELEQEAIIAGYISFVNTLTFPVQIVVRSTKVNIDPYIKSIRLKANDQQNTLLKDQALSYASFIEKLVDVADIMQKRFYIVIPQDDNPPKKSTFSDFLNWMNVDDSAAKITSRNRRFHQRSILLRDRVNLVESGLHNVGLLSTRLSTHELIELYYQMFNPTSALEQKLPMDLSTEDFVH